VNVTRRLLILAALAAIGVGVSTTSAEAAVINRSTTTAGFVVRKVVDGDTVDVTKAVRAYRIRLIGIDTPEVYGGVQCGGRQASALAKRLLPVGTRVSLTTSVRVQNQDRYNRYLRYIGVPRVGDYGAYMLRSGWAKAGYDTGSYGVHQQRAQYRAPWTPGTTTPPAPR
jgi:endonuclease YncB( thermonuclease family)